MSTIHRVKYQTVVNGQEHYQGDNLETAIRAWDSASVYRANLHGGIQVQAFDPHDRMIRDGWVLHVSESGHVYLNPNLLDKTGGTARDLVKGL